MNKSKATTALKSLLVSGCALFVWGMTPVFLASTLTSCEKLEDILGGGDDDEDDGDGSSSGNLNGVVLPTERLPISIWKRLASKCLP